MVEQQRYPSHWCSTLDDLNVENAWGLDKRQIHAYLCSVATFLSEHCSNAELRRTCCYYHHDHQFVEALTHAACPYHNECWQICISKATDILQKAHKLWFSDVAIDGDDLVQVASMALTKSLPSFAYRSAFDTWMHTVVIQSVNRFIRDSYAQKRFQRPKSLDAIPDFDQPTPDGESPETQADYQFLIAMIRTILTKEENERLAHIFQLSILDDHTTQAIGRQVHLHPSRVRALLMLAREKLQQHPEMRAWLEVVDFSSDEGIIS